MAGHGVITEVWAGEFGTAEIEPPILCGFARGGMHDLDDCVYMLATMKASDEGETSDLLAVGPEAQKTMRDKLKGLSSEDSKITIEARFSQYGHALIWNA